MNRDPIEHPGLGVTHHLWSDAKSAILDHIGTFTPVHLITITPEMCLRAHRDEKFAGIISNAGIVVPDGVGVVWGETRLTGKKVEKIPGIDLASWAIDEVIGMNGRIFLLGSIPDVVEKAAGEIKNKYPGFDSIKWRDGYFDTAESNRVVDEIAAHEPHILLVGMGSPRQEEFIAHNLNRLNCAVAIGVGGSFDIWSGLLKRAPELFQATGTEWLYRTFTQPSARLKRIPELWRFTGLVFTIERSRKLISH